MKGTPENKKDRAGGGTSKERASGDAGTVRRKQKKKPKKKQKQKQKQKGTGTGISGEVRDGTPASPSPPGGLPPPAAAAPSSPRKPRRRLVRPPCQPSLTEEELREQVQRVLTGDDPGVPRNVCRYSHRDRCFKLDPPGQSEHVAVHLYDPGCSLHVGGAEYREQRSREEGREEREAERAAAAAAAAAASRDEEGGEGRSAVGAKMTATARAATEDRNQFNYSERATQTFNRPTRCREANTEPPPIAQYSANVSQWQIYDSYMTEAGAGRAGRQADSGGGGGGGGGGGAGGVGGDEAKDSIHGGSMGRALRITERLINQNSEDEIFQDFKYWEDSSDIFRQGEGTLLPLWRFVTGHALRKQATSVCWNPRYADLFAVGYGSYDFSKQGSGMISLFSLKNTSFPECTLRTESGVMCLDFHPQHPSLLAVGCYDGSVLVFDVSGVGLEPIYASSIRTGKHMDPVWQVHWQKEDYSKESTFYSVSSDGKVAKWNISKNDLKMELAMTLKLVPSVEGTGNAVDEVLASMSTTVVLSVAASTGSSLSGLANGCCFDFNEVQEHLFLVGTEEGRIHKCSKAYSGQYLETYIGHNMAVYSIKWNPFNENIFLSCSADWTVKLWHRDRRHPIMSFDLGNAVGDISWSPYSSTVFAAVTGDGKVHVFDLSVNKKEALCQQKVIKKARLTQVRFNAKDYILIVGDDRGVVHSLKLSPNLRKRWEDLEREEGSFVEGTGDAFKASQRRKMESLLETCE